MTSPLALYALCLLTGAASEAAGLLWLLHSPRPSLSTTNYRGASVLGKAGLTLIAPLVLVAVWAAARPAPWGVPALPVAVAAGAAGAFLLLGWLDDTYGSAETRGLLGHLTLLATRGRLTTGAIKATGGVVVGLGTAWMLGVRGWPILPGAALIALSANALNALDTRPGRAVKAFLVAAIPLAAASAAVPPTAAAVVLAGLVGAALVLGPLDLRERVMLGDSGANPLGCALGVTVVIVAPWPAWTALAVALLAACLAGDRWSLNTVIDRSPLLRRIDAWGRPGEPADCEPDGE